MNTLRPNSLIALQGDKQMACYNTLKNGGDADSSKSMLIHLYPNKSGDDNEAENAIANRLETACDSLLNDNQIGITKLKYPMIIQV